MLMAAAFLREPPRRVVITGDMQSQPARSLLDAAHAAYQPFKIVMGVCGPVEASARAMPCPPGGAIAHVCVGTACQPPVGDPVALRAMLSKAL
jgi:uncharacterized protein YyaL (SSP411 family)